MMKSKKNKLGLLYFTFIIGLFVFLAVPTNTAAKSVKIKFDTDGGNSISDKEYKCGDQMGELPVPVKEGYSFVTWYNPKNVWDTYNEKTIFNGLWCRDRTFKARWVASDTCAAFQRQNPNQAQWYGLEIKRSGNNLVVQMNSNDTNDKDGVFHVYKVDYVTFEEISEETTNMDEDVYKSISADELNQNFTFSKDTDVSLTSSIKIPIPSDKKPTRFNVYMKPTQETIDRNKNFIDSCGDDGEFAVRVTYDYYGPSGQTAEEVVTFPSPPSGQGIIDCSTVSDPQPGQTASFEQEFCRDLRRAEAAGVSTTTFGEGQKATSVSTFKCSFSKPLETHDLPVDAFGDASAGDYYENKSYLVGKTSFDYVVDSYVYNFGGAYVETDRDGNQKVVYISEPFKVSEQKPAVTEDVTCNVDCTEVVTIEYGPPVASQAGFCFEYKVKVTSRVNCSASAPQPPSYQTTGYCTPAPGCDHGKGYVDRAAGPSEEFDSCVLKCDGGKYSTKCSVSCYDKVYNSGTGALNKTNSYDFGDFIATDLTTYDNDTVTREGDSCDGYYIRLAGQANTVLGEIRWVPQNHFGRWYCEKNKVKSYGHHGCLKSYAQGGGISAVCGCYAKCRWNECEGNVYINPGVSVYDAKINKEKYEEAIDKCTSYSRCSETQATFSMSVDYYDKDNVEQHVYFPYTDNCAVSGTNTEHAQANCVDTIQYSRDAKKSTCTSNKDNSTILSSAGCYDCIEKEGGNEVEGTSNNFYQTEWSFPGVWMHNKTHVISYKPQTGDGWKKIPYKFCLPEDMKDVNTEWYGYYFLEKFAYDDDTKSRYSFFQTTTVTEDPNTCRATTCRTWTEAKDSFNSDDIVWNIHGKARKFGMFEWNIDVDCFYATSGNFPQTICETIGDCEHEPSSRVRSVDLGNLFPAEDGSKLTSPDTAGRKDVPYNWSIWATDTKTENYTSQPVSYMGWVQKTNYQIYQGDEYLDYEINLTKDLINQLRNRNRNYTNFEGNVAVDSVITYQSNLFRGDNPILLSNSHVPSTSVLGCNNIRNYNATTCENVHGEVD